MKFEYTIERITKGLSDEFGNEVGLDMWRLTTDSQLIEDLSDDFMLKADAEKLCAEKRAEHRAADAQRRQRLVYRSKAAGIVRRLTGLRNELSVEPSGVGMAFEYVNESLIRLEMFVGCFDDDGMMTEVGDE